MAVQAGCGFKSPTPVFAVPLPVGGEAGRRADVTSSPPRDGGSDLLMSGRRSGQWVTLSKTLLLQLVERICQLSFQPDVVVTSSNAASSRLYRKSSSDELAPEVEIESLRPRSPSAERGVSALEPTTCEEHGGQNVMEDSGTVAEDESSQTVPCQDDSVPTTLPGQTTSGSGASPGDVNLPAASACGDVDQESSVELDVEDASVNADEAAAECSGGTAAVERPRDTRPRDVDDARHPRCYQHHYRLQRSAACRRRLIRSRRRKKAAAATAAAAAASSDGGMQVRHPSRRGDVTHARRAHLRDVRRSRQSWMALSKDIVIGAVENQLRHVDAAAGRSLVPAPSKSAAIWNPATCLSPSEKRRSRPAYSDLDCAPPPALNDFRYSDVTFHHTGSGVISRSSTGSSSMLSELLGFGSAAAPTVVLPVAAEVMLTSRQRHCSYSGGETTTYDIMSPSVISGSGVKSQSQSGETSVSDDVATAIDYCIRRDACAASAPDEDASNAGGWRRIWRPVESHPPVKSTARRGVTRPRWVAVNKGDVCSLVDNLVSTMIASEDRGTETSISAGDVRDASTLAVVASTSSTSASALPVSARCSVAASEPRKWKSDLLQRMRNEDT